MQLGIVDDEEPVVEVVGVGDDEPLYGRLNFAISVGVGLPRSLQTRRTLTPGRFFERTSSVTASE